MALNRISTEIIEVKIEGAETAERQLDELQDSLEGVERTSRNVDNATNSAGGGFSSLQASITTAGAAMAGFQAAAALAASALSAIKAPVNLAMDFERQFAQVRTLNSQIGDDLKNELLSLAAEVPQTAGDLTSAAYQAISAGIAPTDVIEFLKSASQTAVAAGGSLTEAVELLTAGVNAFGNQGETAGSISNKLFATVKRGVTTIPELNAVFGRASAAASSYGVSVDEVLGAIAQLTLQGLPTSEAVTRVNAVLKELSNESGTAAKALKDQGVQLGVNALKQKGLVGVLKEVNEATRGQADATARLSGRQEAVQGFLKLTGDNMTAYSSIVQGITEDLTAAGDATEIMANTTDGANALFEAAAEGAIRELGFEILPAFTELLKSVTKQLGSGGAGQAIKVFGSALAGVVKIVQVFVENVGKIGLALTAAFGAAYAMPFIAALTRMKAAVVLFHTNFTALASAAGTSSGLAYGRLFLAGARSILLGPVGIGLGVLFGAMLLDSFQDAADEAEAAQRKQQQDKSKEDLARFVRDNKLRTGIANELLKTGNRDLLQKHLLTQAADALRKGNDKLAHSTFKLSQMVAATSKGYKITLQDMNEVSAEGTQAFLLSTNNQRLSLDGVAKSLQKASAAAYGYDGQVVAITTAIKDYGTVNKESLETAKQETEARKVAGIQLAALKKRLADHIAITEDGNKAVLYDMASVQNVIAQTRDAIKDQEALIAGLGGYYQQFRMDAEAAAFAQAKLRMELRTLQGLQDDAADIAREAQDLQDRNLTALDKEILTIKAMIDLKRFLHQADQQTLENLNQLEKSQIAAAKARFKREKDQDKARRAASRAYLRNLRKIETLERKLAEKAARASAERIKAENAQTLASIANTKELTQAKIDAANLDPVEAVRQSIQAEAKEQKDAFEQRKKQLNDEFAERMRAAKVTQSNGEAALKREKVFGSQLEKRKDLIKKTFDLEKRVAEEKKARDLAALKREQDQQKALAGIQNVQRLSAAKQQQANQLSERASFLSEMSDLDQLHAMAKFDAETERLRREYQQQEFFLTASRGEQQRINDAFDDARLRGRRKHAKEIEEIERQQVLSAMSATENAIGEIGAVADALGASESFVGKIEAAQILARGVMHGFEGASEQAEALTDFADGNVAGGIAHQAAAIAHFAQAGAAPIMARRAATRGGGGGGPAGGGAVSASGPRTTATESRPEQRERQASIQFGDIVLSDVPALLSRQGSRELGRRIAGSVAQELNRQRALPNGARI